MSPRSTPHFLRPKLIPKVPNILAHGNLAPLRPIHIRRQHLVQVRHRLRDLVPVDILLDLVQPHPHVRRPREHDLAPKRLEVLGELVNFVRLVDGHFGEGGVVLVGLGGGDLVLFDVAVVLALLGDLLGGGLLQVFVGLACPEVLSDARHCEKEKR